MRYFLLFTLLSVFFSLNAQYGTTYQFHFSLQDPATGFDSATDIYKVKTKKRGRVLLIKTNGYTYEVNSDYNVLSADNGRITISYSVVPPNVNFDLSILRRHKRTKEWFHLELIYPQDKDFARLQWRHDSCRIDLSYDRNPYDYDLITPKTEDGQRDLSCLINASCEPQWELSSLGLYKQEQARIKKFQRIKWSLDYRIDSLITAHFPNDIFERFFQEKCVTAYYYGDTTYTAPDCEIPIDTNLFSLTRHYTLKSPPTAVALNLSISGSIHQTPYIAEWQFGDKKFAPSELNILSPAEIRAFALKEYPEVDFAKDANGLPYVGLVYLSALPQNTYPSFDYEPLISTPAEPKETPSWFGTFAYLMQVTLPEQGTLSGIANYYFYAHKARLLISTAHYYDLTDE